MEDMSTEIIDVVQTGINFEKVTSSQNLGINPIQKAIKTDDSITDFKNVNDNLENDFVVENVVSLLPAETQLVNKTGLEGSNNERESLTNALTQNNNESLNRQESQNTVIQNVTILNVQSVSNQDSVVKAVPVSDDVTLVDSKKGAVKRKARQPKQSVDIEVKDKRKARRPKQGAEIEGKEKKKVRQEPKQNVDTEMKDKKKTRQPKKSVEIESEAKEKPKRVREKKKQTQETVSVKQGKRKVAKISKTLATVIDPHKDPLAKDVHSQATPKKTQTVTNLRCMVCDKNLTSEQNLMRHLLTHNNNHTCTICMKTFKSTHFLKHHMDKHNESYLYSCPVCDKKFKFKNNMRGHLRKHTMEKKFECDICQKKFIGKYNLKEHMKAHSDDRPFECDFCKKAYKDRGALNKHLLTHQEKKVECSICKRQFTNQKQVARHMQFHYSWPGDSFKRKTNVGPNGEKLKYKCQYCDKAFNHYSNMNAHLHKKHKERKVQCTECPKTFAYQYELREHMFIHFGSQSSKFKCQVCDKSFQRSTTLKNHERTTHLGIKRFSCEVCGKMFGTKFNMKVHVEKIHAENNGNEDNPKPRRPRTQKAERNVTQATAKVEELVEQLQPTPPEHHFLAPLPVTLPPPHQHPLLRNMSTSDIIRNAISHIPELGYFPPLQPHPTRGYQFYGIPPTDFGVT